MALVSMTMTAHGIEAEVCSACERRFPRGERMNAFEYGDGEPAGWHCDACRRLYERWGRFDPDAAKAAALKGGA